MEKESLIEGFKERLGDRASAVSDRSYNEIAEAALPMFTDDDKVTEDTWKMPVQMLNSLVGQYMHDVADGINKGKDSWLKEQDEANKKAISDAVAKAKSEWEASKGATLPKVDTKKDDVNGNDSSAILEQMKALLSDNNSQLLSEDGAIGKLSKTVTAFMDSYNKQQRAVQESNIRKEISEYLSGKSATYAPAVNMAVRNLQIGENPDIDALKMQVEKDYMSIVKDFYGDGGKPFGGTGTGGTGKSLVDDYIKQRAEVAQKEANDAENLRKSFK